MAAAESPSQSPERLPRIQPLPLSSKQEDEIRKIYNKNVREHCTDQIRDFAACAREHMVSVNFTCRDQKLAMNSCLRKNGTMAEQDRAREEWFATRLQKKKDAAEQEAERLRKVYAERKRIEEIEERQKQTETNKSSWWPFR